jgi:hypothetical protein
MNQNAPHSPIAAMRALTQHLDGAVEDVMEAHGFALAQITATGSEAAAVFLCDTRIDGIVWRLAIRQPIAAAACVAMSMAGEDNEHMSLVIHPGAGAVESVAAAVGLAVSFATLSGQLRDGV